MKKSLYLTTALVAAGVLALGSTDAMAKEKPMKIGVSVSYKAVVGYAKNADGFMNATGGATTQTSYQAIDVKTDSEVHFKGSVKTDAGLTIGVGMELESDQASTATIDGSYMTIGGGFGTITLGNTVAAAASLAVNPPSTGAVGNYGGDSAAWIVKPAAVSVAATAGGNIGGADHAKIKWMSKSFSGFSVGASYVPSTTNSNALPAGGGASSEIQQHDIGVKYSAKMGGNTVSAGINYWSQDAGTADIDAYHVGISVAAGAFTVGASMKEVSAEGNAADGTSMADSATSPDEEAVTAGVQWAQGGATLSLNYFTTEKELTSATTGEDSVEKWTVGAKYAMGPGVDFLGTIQNVKWSDEGTVAANNNKGTAIVGGIAVKF
jgi:outer membrane protein OmpU